MLKSILISPFYTGIFLYIKCVRTFNIQLGNVDKNFSNRHSTTFQLLFQLIRIFQQVTHLCEFLTVSTQFSTREAAKIAFNVENMP